MYSPNFCAECGTKIVRLKCHVWTSRRFCDACAKSLRKERVRVPLLATGLLLTAGFIAGRAGRPPGPPLTIERSASSPLNSRPVLNQSKVGETGSRQLSGTSSVEGPVYMCGARTKKGTPCSRRVHGPVRCWQHKGAQALLPQDKLLVKEETR